MKRSIGTYVGAGSLALLVLGPAGAHVELLPPIVGLYVFAAGLLAGVVALVWGVVAYIRSRRLAALLVSALGVPAVVVTAAVTVAGMGYPRINDISTDLDDPPALSVAPDYPERFKEVVAAHYYDVRTLAVGAGADHAFDAAVTAAEARSGWTVTSVDRAARTFEGYEKTRLFRFRDDFVVRVRPTDAGAAIDMRSRSRVGKGDLGVNAKRIRSFLRALKTALEAPGA